MTFQSEADYFASRAEACRRAAGKSKSLADALANAHLAERYDSYSSASRDREDNSPLAPPVK